MTSLTVSPLEPFSPSGARLATCLLAQEPRRRRLRPRRPPPRRRPARGVGEARTDSDREGTRRVGHHRSAVGRRSETGHPDVSCSPTDFRSQLPTATSTRSSRSTRERTSGSASRMPRSAVSTSRSTDRRRSTSTSSRSSTTRSPTDPVGLAVRAGWDWRTQVGAIFDAVPDYSRSGFSDRSSPPSTSAPARASPSFRPTSRRCPASRRRRPKTSTRDVFQVPVALSIAVTPTVNVQGEVYPNTGKTDSAGVGWIVSIEKTLLRHRFAFTCGNVRSTTVDQYVSPVPFGNRREKLLSGLQSREAVEPQKVTRSGRQSAVGLRTSDFELRTSVDQVLYQI